MVGLCKPRVRRILPDPIIGNVGQFNRFLTMKRKLRVESRPAVFANEPDPLGPSSIAAHKNFRFPPTQGRKQVRPRLA
jgi:hypothetical protein